MNHKDSYDFFPVEAVDTWVATKLAGYNKIKDVATIDLGEDDVPPEAITKWAELAKALKLPVRAGYNSLKIVRPTTREAQRQAAVYEMRQAYERGEIDASGHTTEAED